MFIQKYNKKNVLEASQERIEFIFDSFEVINISISGGKDSTVLAHLFLEEAKKRGRKVGLLFIDEEVVYNSTIKQIEYLMNLYPANVNKLWLQFEFLLTNAASLEDSQLVCWEKGKHKKWMRSKKNDNILFPPWDRKKEIIRNKNKGVMIGFYDVIENMESCYNNAAFIIGVRATESPNRWRSVSKNPNFINGQNVFWSTKRKENYLLYPIFDWNFHDIWKYIYDNKLKYSKVYDWQFKRHFKISEMRVSSLIHEKSFKSICELPEFEPETYEKLCKRIKGISLVQETGKNSKMFRVRKLPKNYKTWKEYKDFLLKTYPDKEKKEIFIKRFSNHLENEFVSRQQCRQLVLNDYENNLPVDNKSDPRDELLEYYRSVL